MRKIILDTDIGSDCDDAGALAVLHQLSRQNECSILAITYCLSLQSGPACIDAINRFYGREDIPVGILPLDEYYPLFADPFTNYIQQNFQNKYSKGTACPNAVKLMRRTLAVNKDIIVCAIGPLTNIYLLLQSQPDEISPLTGIELVSNSVKELYIMGGRFDGSDDSRIAEFNIRSDVESAKYVFNNCPVPIFIVPHEVGRRIMTGQKLLNSGSPENPVRKCYEIFCNKNRESWDLLTVLLAVRPDELYWNITKNVAVNVDDHGITSLKKDCSGNCNIVTGVGSVKEVEKLLDTLMQEPSFNM